MGDPNHRGIAMIKVFTFNLPGDVTVQVSMSRQPADDPKANHALTIAISDDDDAIETEPTEVNYCMAQWLCGALDRAQDHETLPTSSP